MKIVIVIVAFFLNLPQIINGKLKRIIVYDEIFRYDLDNVTHFNRIFTHENLMYEIVDDDTMQLGGYIEFIKSLNKKLPLHLEMKTQYLDKAIWNDGGIRLTEYSICPELLNPSRFWYNVTKLWKSCPPEKGDKWEIEYQILNMQIELPSSLPSALWKWQFLMSQEIMGMKQIRFGFTFKLEFIPV